MAIVDSRKTFVCDISLSLVVSCFTSLNFSAIFREWPRILNVFTIVEMLFKCGVLRGRNIITLFHAFVIRIRLRDCLAPVLSNV